MSSAELVEEARASHQPMGLTEFVVFASTAMAINALATSIMLSALPEIAAAYALQNANAQQLVLTIFFVGFSLGQFIVGPISDRFGRRSVLIAGLGLYSLASLICVVAPSFTVLLAARLTQGLASASPRVVITSAVRDCYVGRRMASLMSLVTMVLFIAPIAAPGVGQLILTASNWQALFVVLLLHGVITLVWALRRFPETQPVAQRRPLELASLFDAFRRFLTTKQSALVTLAGGACQGCPLAFLVSSPLVIGSYYGLGQYFTLAFSAIAVTMGLAAFSNSRLVARFGMRRIARWSLVHLHADRARCKLGCADRRAVVRAVHGDVLRAEFVAADELGKLHRTRARAARGDRRHRLLALWRPHHLDVGGDLFGDRADVQRFARTAAWSAVSPAARPHWR